MTVTLQPAQEIDAALAKPDPEGADSFKHQQKEIISQFTSRYNTIVNDPQNFLIGQVASPDFIIERAESMIGGSGRTVGRALCKYDVRPREGFHTWDLSLLRKGIYLDSVFMFERGGLNDGYHKLRFNASRFWPHVHRKDKFHTRVVDGGIKIEIVLKPEFQEELTNLFKSTWLRAMALEQKVRAAEGRETPTGEVDVEED